MTTTTMNENKAVGFENGTITINVKDLKANTVEGAKNISKKVIEKAATLKVKLNINKKKVMAAGLAVVIATGAFAGIGAYASTTGYKGVLNDLCGKVNARENSMDSLAETILPEFAYMEYENIMGVIGENDYVVNAVENTEDRLDGLYVQLDDYFGADAKVSYEIIEEEAMSKSQLRRAESYYEDFYESYLQNFVDTVNEYDYERISNIAESYDLATSDVRCVIDSANIIADGMENAEITKGYNLEIRLTVDGNKDTYSETFECSMINLNGDWMIDYNSVYELDSTFRSMAGQLNDLLWYL